MEQLFQKSNFLIRNTLQKLIRSAMDTIDWSDRLIGVLGARGTGKTTLLLQYAKEHFSTGKEVLYITLDDIYFTEHKLVDVVATFNATDGKLLLLDEVHKYPDWAREIKNCYDFYPELKIIFTGSSIMDILRQNADLSRRAIQYQLPGLSFREFLYFSGIVQLQAVSFEDILTKHLQLSGDIASVVKPLAHFVEYLRYGYYPFFKENLNTYSIRLEQMVKVVIENDLQFVEGFDPHNTRKIYQLLYVLSANVPFKPNISKLSEKIGITRNTLLQYIHYLGKAKLINTLETAGKSVSILQKPDKIFLENTNLNYTLSPGNADKGSIREAFFLNQVKNANYTVHLPASGDFLINGQYTIEVGGKDKAFKQTNNISQSYIAADDTETGFGNKIPLWLFGMMY
jgi:hypothetical protein